MRIAHTLAALLLTLTSAASAAPIQGVVDAQTGFVYASGLTGEDYVSLSLPTAFAVRPPTGVDPPFPAQVTEFFAGGINGTYEFGNIVKPYLRQTDFATFRLRRQATFVSEFVEFPPSFVSHPSAIPAGQAGLFVIVPEPASCSLLLASAGVLVAGNRRQRSRQRGLAVH